VDRNARELVDWLRNYAASLRYHSDQGILKQQLHEAATLISKGQVIIKREGRHMVIGAAGQPGWRRLTWRERLALWLLRDKTEIRP